MDVSLRCNSLKCRVQLNDRAVVTTCSHIFCVPCAEALGLADPGDNNARVCPACETHLANPDDAAVTRLNPTEDYKTSVLSGLGLSDIMECAGRGLSFYSYQTAQEIVYQEFLARSLTDKYAALSSHMDNIINDANTEIVSLRDKLSTLQLEQSKLEQKNHDLSEAFREKAKHQQQLQKLYARLKQEQLSQGIELAADHNADHVLQGAGVGKRHSNDRPTDAMHTRGDSVHSGGSGGRRMPANEWQAHIQGSRAGLQSACTAPVDATPSAHRTRLPQPTYSNQGATMLPNASGLRHGTPLRPALNNLDPNVYSGSNIPGYGMSAGVKMGRQQNGPIGRPSGTSRPGGYGALNIR